jgi:hypothetical protein
MNPDVVVGSYWRRRGRGDRLAKVVRVNGEPWNTVEYIYLVAADSRGRGLMGPRTNTTGMRIDRFVTQFECEKVCWTSGNLFPGRDGTKGNG